MIMIVYARYNDDRVEHNDLNQGESMGVAGGRTLCFFVVRNCLTYGSKTFKDL